MSDNHQSGECGGHVESPRVNKEASQSTARYPQFRMTSALSPEMVWSKSEQGVFLACFGKLSPLVPFDPDHVSGTSTTLVRSSG